MGVFVLHIHSLCREVLSPAGGAPSTLALSGLQLSFIESVSQLLAAPLQSFSETTRLVFAVRGGGGQLVEEDVGVAAADLTGGHGAHPGVIEAVPLPERRVPAVRRVMASQSVPGVV